MEKRIYPEPIQTIASPEPFARQSFTDPREAVAALDALYRRNTAFLRDSFVALGNGGDTSCKYRAYSPEVGVTTSSYSQVDSRQAYGHMPSPGHYTTTITNFLLLLLLVLLRRRLDGDGGSITTITADG